MTAIDWLGLWAALQVIGIVLGIVLVVIVTVIFLLAWAWDVVDEWRKKRRIHE